MCKKLSVLLSSLPIFVCGTVATSVNASQTMVVQNVNMVSHRNSISFRGNVDPKFSNGDLRVVALDENNNKVYESEKLVLNRRGQFNTEIKNLEQSTNYRVYVSYSYGEGDSKNVIFSSSIEVSTLRIKTQIEFEGTNNVKIKIVENNLPDEYYPLYLVLKLNGQVFKSAELPKKDNLILNLTGLRENLNYTYEIVTKGENIEKVVDNGMFKTFQSDKNENQGSINSEILYYTLTNDDINKSNIEDTKIDLFLNDIIQNFAIGVKEFKSNIEGLDIKFVNGKLTINNLIPSKHYSDLKIYFDSKRGNRIVLNIAPFKTLQETSDINDFVKSVYFNAFNRNPDEKGFRFWVDSLSNEQVSFENFVRNLLSEEEFLTLRPTTESKIEGLYKVIVNRESDDEGLRYWIGKYDMLISKGCSKEFALGVVVETMINENEFRNIVNGLKRSLKKIA